MKILMQGKIELFESSGGDKVQIENTALELEKLGIKVDIIPGFKADYSKYDVVHLFQMDWTPETYLYAKKAKKAGRPVVLSPIHHSVEEVKKFDDLYTFDFRRLARLLFNDQFKRDTLKNVYKSFFDKRKAYPTFYSMAAGLKNMQRKTLQMADIVLVQTEGEARDLKRTYGVDFEWVKVVNGVGEPYIKFKQDESSFNPLGIENYIISVGRIEARKNQIKIIEAVEMFRKEHGIDVKLVFIGVKSKLKHFEYIRHFNKKVRENPWIIYLGKVPYHEMPAYYKHAKVCVSASWFETTGLTSLEALFCGTNAVASGERAKEYLHDHASYCDPADLRSIFNAVAYEYFAPRPHELHEELKTYTWANAAGSTLKVYERIIKNASV